MKTTTTTFTSFYQIEMWARCNATTNAAFTVLYKPLAFSEAEIATFILIDGKVKKA